MSNLYQHYKNKPYLYLETVKHSETLEDMVLYRCRYENDNGKLWVRPKTMFFEDVELNGVKVPRFAKLDIQLQEFSSVSAEIKKELIALLNRVFGSYSEEKIISTLHLHQKIHLVIARHQEQFVGFKIGYARNAEIFYSWLGAVHPDYQGGGIGQDLMSAQHVWCKKNGFQTIETRTKNKWRNMLLLNIKNKFEIVGTTIDQSGSVKILMEKKLELLNASYQI